MSFHEKIQAQISLAVSVGDLAFCGFSRQFGNLPDDFARPGGCALIYPFINL